MVKLKQWKEELLLENMQLLEYRKWAVESDIRKAESRGDLSEIREQATEEMLRTSKDEKP